MRNSAILAALLVIGFSSTVLAQGVKVDSSLPDYKAVSGISGNIKTEGSDTMNNMIALWAEGFKKFYPNVKIEIVGKGSSTAPPALIAGTATFGPMSRKMKNKEVSAFEKAFGYKPIQLPTSIDMLAVYVHKDNPIKHLSMKQVDAIFSKTRRFGLKNAIDFWGQLGLEGIFSKLPISLYGRNAASGTYGYFKKHALGKGDFRDSVKEQPGSASVVQGIARDKSAIGYSGIGYKTANVRALPLSKNNGEFVAPTPENANKYPLARFLWLSVNHKPGEELDPLRREFLRYVYSKQGQTEVIKDGYLPVSAKIAKRSLEKVGIVGTP